MRYLYENVTVKSLPLYNDTANNNFRGKNVAGGSQTHL